HVFDVEFELALPFQRVATTDLRQTGDPRTDVVPARLLRRVAIQVLHQQRTRSYETHRPFKNVEEFGQFIEARGTQDSTDGCQPRPVVLVVPANAHGPELENIEGDPMSARTRLSKQHWRPHRDPDYGCRDHH